MFLRCYYCGIPAASLVTPSLPGVALAFVAALAITLYRDALYTLRDTPSICELMICFPSFMFITFDIYVATKAIRRSTHSLLRNRQTVLKSDYRGAAFCLSIFSVQFFSVFLEMIEILGGSDEAEGFRLFEQLMIQGYALVVNVVCCI